MTLIDKEQESYFIKNNEVRYLFEKEEVKKSVLEMRSEIRMIADCKLRNKLLDKHRKIFGDFEK